MIDTFVPPINHNQIKLYVMLYGTSMFLDVNNIFNKKA